MLIPSPLSAARKKREPPRPKGKVKIVIKGHPPELAKMLRNTASKHLRAARLQSFQFTNSVSKMSYSTTAHDDVIFSNANNAKIITLNRPQKLNSLNFSMVQKIYPRLIEYSKSDVTDLVIQNSNGRAFCAGGDVASCVENNLKGDFKESIKFFQEEYSLNYLLAVYPKPVVSLTNGIVMGGGVGLSIHTPFRVATENTRWAMPEMDIGFTPDVGATFALNRHVPSSLGWYLALTGENILGWDNYFLGLSSHFVPSQRIPELTKALSEIDYKASSQIDKFEIVNNIIEEYTEPLPADYKPKYTPEQLRLIDQIFSENAIIETIFKDLENEGSEFALQTLKTLQRKSALSLKVSLELLQRAATLDIHEALTSELNAANKFMQDSDFNEGVSSKLIRKSKELPNWKFKTPEEVTLKDILPFFSKSSTLKLDNHFDVTYNNYPYNFGLPKESEIRAFIKGEDGFTEKGAVITRKEVVDHFSEAYKDKTGLVRYLNYVLDSKAITDGDALQWKL